MMIAMLIKNNNNRLKPVEIPSDGQWLPIEWKLTVSLILSFPDGHSATDLIAAVY